MEDGVLVCCDGRQKCHDDACVVHSKGARGAVIVQCLSVAQGRGFNPKACERGPSLFLSWFPYRIHFLSPPPYCLPVRALRGEQARVALRAAFNDVSRAASYLMEGIPDDGMGGGAADSDGTPAAMPG